jgi:FtsZ-interacting cell division protein ZipA
MMSDLQIALLVIGIVIVAAVLVFNWLQERRFRKQAAAAFETSVGDALMKPAATPRESPGRIEPGLHEPTLADVTDLNVGESAEPRVDIDRDVPHDLSHNPFAAHEPAPAVNTPPAFRESVDADAVSAPLQRERVVTPVPAESRVTAGQPISPYDELIEYRIRIGGGGILASVFADAINQTRSFGKPVRWSGLPEGGSAWEEVQPWRDVHYQQLLVTMQLADRNGAAQEEELSALCSLVQATAQAHGLGIACDDVVDAVERAQSIDRFCVDVDVLIGLNIVGRGDTQIDLSRIVSEAEHSGMVLGRDGVYQLLDSRGEPLYALYNHDAEPFTAEAAAAGQTSQGVTLQFDVPRVPDGTKVFDTMVALGRKLANESGSLLVDDNLRPLTDAGIEKIRSQLAHIYERMEARGVPSGSRRALRLFS